MFHKYTKILLLSLSLLWACNTALADSNKVETTIILKDGVVTPKQINIKTNTIIVITVINKGKATAEFESKSLHIEKVLMSGASATFSLKNLSPGSYKFVDEFTEDQETSHGVIIVK